MNLVITYVTGTIIAVTIRGLNFSLNPKTLIVIPKKKAEAAYCKKYTVGNAKNAFLLKGRRKTTEELNQ